jgi:hypothetical protein
LAVCGVIVGPSLGPDFPRVRELNLSSGGALNEARANVGIALSNLIHDHGPPTPQSIDKAKRAIEAWIWELEASPAA